MDLNCARPSRRSVLKSLGALGLAAGLSQMPANPGWPATVHADQSGISGQATDIYNQRPVAGALVTAWPGDVRTHTGPDGRFSMTLAPGRYEIRIAVQGYIGMSQTRQDITANSVRPVSFALIPERLEPAAQQTVQERLLPGPRDASGAPNRITAPDAQRVPQVSLPCQVWVQVPDGRVELIGLEEYLKGVLPAEMPAYWPQEALKAQAVAARSYAVAHAASNGYICTTARCQVWTPTHYATTDAAVDATRGVVATFNNTVIWGFYFSQCNGRNTLSSEDAVGSIDGWRSCGAGGWSSLPYARARPCTGHSPANNNCGYTGHGVGMCQHGARARAIEGKDCAQIVGWYFSGINLQTPQTVALEYPADAQIVPGGSNVQLRWAAGAAEYRVAVLDASGKPVAESQWMMGSNWAANLPPLPGTYYWFVRSRTACGEGPTSDLRRMTVTVPSRRFYVPLVDKAAVR